MLKPASLRKALFKSVPLLRDNPDMLRLFVDGGVINATLAASLSHENRYTLDIVVTDYTGDINMLIVPVNVWLREHQPDIMTTDEGRKNGFTYVADINSDDSSDVRMSLRLTERTIVKEDGRRLNVTPLDEPPLPEPVARPMELYLQGELVSKWDE
ncbi:phage tail protein [Rahnella sp. BCC 1045]|uniref:phage tail protein n=1 Tax=Rahnella sp. BCC 1045 TaxID=2816251 RepID=UPI001C26B464|nr:phage tail protein [Rahnella sp. BCC 1045]MBU9818440.1 phage tail protein [Rahnella sp. BCC 1045]